jgi:hypothetical protein
LLFVPDDVSADVGCCGELRASGDGDGQPALNMPNPEKVGHVGRCALPIVLDDVGVGFLPDDVSACIGCCGGLGASGDGDGQPMLNMPNPGKVGHVGRCTLPSVLDDVGVGSLCFVPDDVGAGSPVICSEACVGSSCLLSKSAFGDVGNDIAVGSVGVDSTVWVDDDDSGVGDVGVNSAIGDADLAVGDACVDNAVGDVGVACAAG